MAERSTLPRTRMQLLRWTYRTQKALLFKISLAVSLFAIPLFFVEGMRGVSLGLLEQKDFLNTDGILSLLYIPAWILLGLGLCGCFGVMKAYTFQEGVWFFLTFRESLKENGKESLKASFLFALMYYLVHFTANFFVLQKPQWQAAVVIVEEAVQILWMGAWVFALCQIPIYRNPVLRTFKNAWIFTFARLPKLLGVLAVTLLPLKAAGFFGIPALTAGVLLAYILLGFGHSILVSTLFCQDSFDRLVNRVHYPQIYRRGLYEEPNCDAVNNEHKEM